MKTMLKRVMSLILTAVLLAGIVPLAGLSGSVKTSAAAAKISFGSYPQSRVTDSQTISVLKACSKTWKDYPYKNDNNQPFMWYADFFYKGTKYRAVQLKAYRMRFDTPTTPSSANSESYQSSNGYTSGQIYYFKYQPLTWHILDSESGYILCDYIIDCQPFQSMLYDINNVWKTENEIARNDYAYTQLRHWLNCDFYNTAFTDTQKSRIMLTELDNTKYDSGTADSDLADYNYVRTKDYIFLPSRDDVLNSGYGFSENASEQDSLRKATGTDYALCQGLISNCYWKLRTPNTTTKAFWGITGSTGRLHDTANVSLTYDGVRPACRITSLENDTTVSAELFSESEAEHSDVIHSSIDRNDLYMFDHPSGAVLGEWHKLSCSCGIYEIIDVKKSYSDQQHYYSFQSTIEPTCTEYGYSMSYCVRCHECYYSKYFPATGRHTYGTSGSSIYSCVYCGSVQAPSVSVSGPASVISPPAIDEQSGMYTAVVQANMQNADGKYFVYWIDSSGEIVGTYRTYRFYVIKDTRLTPVYASEKDYSIERANAAAASRMIDAKSSGGQITFFAEHSVSSDNAMNGHGIIVTTDPVKKNSLDIDNADYNFAARTSNQTKTGLLEVTAAIGSGRVWARPYVINGSGEYIYGNTKEYAVTASEDSYDGIVMIDSESFDIAQQDEESPVQKPDLISSIIQTIVSVITKLAEYVMLALSVIK